LSSCADLTSADALGLLVRTAAGNLEMLSATSHQAAELELYQLQHDSGPCLDSIRTGRPLAAVATIVIVQTTELTVEQLSSRIDAALEGRTVIEQTEGVLAQYNGVDMATAYQVLRARADEQSLTLTDVAARILQEAAQR
jgi:hypothetical protein